MGGETIHIAARVPTKIVQRFDKAYPFLSRQYFVTECFKQAVAMASLDLAPDELVGRTIARVAQKRTKDAN